MLGLNFQVDLSSFENSAYATGTFPIEGCKFWPPRIITLCQYHWRMLKEDFVCGRARFTAYSDQLLSQLWKYWALWLCVVNLPFPGHVQATYYRLVEGYAWFWNSRARSRCRAGDTPMQRTPHISPASTLGMSKQ